MLAIAPTQRHNRPGGLDGFRGQAGYVGAWLFFFAYDWTDSIAKDLSSQPVALLPGCALPPCSVAAIRGEWWMGQDQ